MPKISWTSQRICKVISKCFNKCVCWYQVKTALGLHAKKGVVGKALTGAGKTLSFFGGVVMALEEEPDGEHMIIVVSPLNLLSKQNVDTLVIIVNPEILMQNDGVSGFGKLWKKPQFTNQILYFVFDEGHCISLWSLFRHSGPLTYHIEA
ncbi:hypothetical protein FIBSPDRAFT_914035 [Athelia psychrophila]|uniref:DEAD/DEAH-box helicase domain-containing protein n=1 Tax=Athelia psychrophila TaxID=1759441 RepID=A0A165YK31_9AGAM|nr:hypothetical protein FIBSPDRAFT_914035 [Fibularhizoctonia sp. CBS 109695]